MEENESQTNNTTELSQLRLSELTKLASELKEKIDEAEGALKAAKEELTGYTQQILRTLDLMDIDSYKAHGFNFYKEHNTSVTVPKTIEEKQALFDFLQSKGIFLEMVSINSKTLNKLYKDFAEEAAKEGILDFRMPGIGEPTLYTNLKLRRQ